MRIDPRWMRYAGALSGAVLTKAVLIYTGYFLGSRADAALGTYPLFFFLGILLGVGLGLWYVFYVAEKQKF